MSEQLPTLLLINLWCFLFQIAFAWLYLSACVRGHSATVRVTAVVLLSGGHLDCLYRRYTKYAERIGALISSDDVSDDHSTGDEVRIIWSRDKVTGAVQ